jgi:hypothetical protein
MARPQRVPWGRSSEDCQARAVSAAAKITVLLVAVAAVLGSAEPPASALAANGAGTKVLVLTPKELPGWRLGENQAVVSGDALATLDPRAAAPTSSRVLDGWIARYAKTKTIISSGCFVTGGPAAARAIVKHLLAAPAQGGAAPHRRVSVGDGGAASISQGSLQSTIDLVWPSGKYVMQVGTQTLGPKSQLSQAQVLALNRRKIRANGSRIRPLLSYKTTKGVPA